jgi:hypothetical protein
MSSRDETKPTNKPKPLPDLNKETLKDLDVERTGADKVKGGAISTVRGTSRH